MYLVFCMTNYGSGYYTAGIYRSREKAEARRQWCEDHTIDPDNDSWRLVYVEGAENKTAPITDGWGYDYDLKHKEQYLEEDDNA